MSHYVESLLWEDSGISPRTDYDLFREQLALELEVAAAPGRRLDVESGLCSEAGPAVPQTGVLRQIT